MEEEKRSDMLQQSYEALDSYTTTDSSWTDFGLRLPIPTDTENMPLPLISSTESLQRVAPADTTSSPPSSPDTIHPAIITFPSQAAPLYWQPGIIGRCASVIPAKPPSDPNYEDLPQELVAKRSWQPKDRLGEDAIIAHIRSLITPHWKKHITDVRGSVNQTMDDLKVPRNNLADIARREIERWKADPETQDAKATSNELRNSRFFRAFIGETHKICVFRISICSRNFLLQEVRDIHEFAKVFLDVVQAHYLVYKEARVLHRDLSANNIMFKCENDEVIGVLNDWDLAIPLELYARPGTSSKHRTGTAAFMALELLDNEGIPIKHEYCHDLESFAWILIWCTFVLQFQGKAVGFKERHSLVQLWTDTIEWPALKARKFDFVTKGIKAHRSGITKAMVPLADTWTRCVFDGMAETLMYKNKFSDDSEDNAYPPDAVLLPGIPLGNISKNKQKKIPEPESFFTFNHFMDALIPSAENHHIEKLKLQSH